MIKAKADVGVIFAGGAGVRMGGCDKSSLTVGGVALGEHIVARLKPQAEQLVYVAPDAGVGQFGTDCRMQFVADILAQDGERLGPAGGLLAALEWTCANLGEDALMLTAPVDAPFFPYDLFEQLNEGRGDRLAAIARHGSRTHPVFGVWRAKAASSVRHIVLKDGIRAMGRILSALEGGVVEVNANSAGFHNINMPEDLETARLLGAASSDLPIE